MICERCNADIYPPPNRPAGRVADETTITREPPSPRTLEKYGLSGETWLAILHRQGGVCAVCKKVPNGRFCIDHDHIRGWKALPPEKRRIHVRGLLCWFCNHTYVGRAITINKSLAVTEYLRQHEDRLIAKAMAR